MSSAVCVRALLILQAFRRFNYVTAHSPNLPSIYLRHSSFSNPSVASRTSLLILHYFFRFSYVTASSLTSPSETPMLQSINIMVQLCDVLKMYRCYESLLKSFDG